MGLAYAAVVALSLLLVAVMRRRILDEARRSQERIRKLDGGRR